MENFKTVEIFALDQILGGTDPIIIDEDDLVLNIITDDCDF